MGIIELHVMETDLALLLVCMPTVQRACNEGAAGHSICVEGAPHGALQTIPASVFLYLFGEDLNLHLLNFDSKDL